ncbi:MAG: bifunctional aspartate kinase/homoserine dehydrogenase I [Cyclobacteriaceae bacterium]|nr:bifunctional aspartate kinase/homoserine dehydrogenase I [Cyclobacteriaceae bacterium]MCH8517683.1 bifunctional aspartate kinase/homoserine dehydrogenase I [Cyclobacteriaceae bacterium]
MQVVKFGGSSVGSTEAIRKVKAILLKKSSKSPLLVIFSAFGGDTNRLIQAAEYAAVANEKYKDILQELTQRQLDYAQELIPPKNQSAAMAQLRVLLNELEDILRGVYLIKELSKRTLDRISCTGEQLSSLILFEFLKTDIPKAQYVDPKQLIVTDDFYGKANVNFELSNERIRQYFQKHQADLFVVPGFLAANQSGETTTLGRGGSDYSAAIFAAALRAAELEIWTDVSGMMTADPNQVKQAFPIHEIDFDEAMELTHFGAKVLYPPAIHPVYKQGIPVRIKNTFAPDDEGTKIHRYTRSEEHPIRGLSAIQDISLLNISGSGMVGIPYFSHRLFEALAQAKINVVLISQASSEHSICVAISKDDTAEATNALEKTFARELKEAKLNPIEADREVSIVALVGSKMKDRSGVSGKMFSVLAHNGISIKAIAQGSSERNISVVVNKREVKKALNSLHESFFLSERIRLNLFVVGVGNVGKVLLEQIASQHEYLLKKHRLDIRLIAVANTKKMAFDEEGIKPSKPLEALHEQGQEVDLSAFIHQMSELNLRNSIFIDNTADAKVAALYDKVLKKSISVVTPNKIACTESYDRYKELKQLSKRHQAHFLFETNVGAGLPVINTLSDLIKSGDEIYGIEAVLSGSLNFIFNNYNGEGDSFAEVVKEAGVQGFTEPDPRIDLSGVDVKRKLLILLRESGFNYELEDISTLPFIPESCMQADDTPAFIKALSSHEKHFKALVEKAKANDKKLKYVATYRKGEAATGLQEVASDSPLYNLEGKDNIVLFYTRRYPEQPLVIKGAGAGAAVTASGIFGDIMRIASAFGSNF